MTLYGWSYGIALGTTYTHTTPSPLPMDGPSDGLVMAYGWPMDGHVDGHVEIPGDGPSEIPRQSGTPSPPLRNI